MQAEAFGGHWQGPSVYTPQGCGMEASYARALRSRFRGLSSAGMRQGFRIGFDRYACQLKSAKSNMHSVADAPEVVQSIAKELAEGRVVGPWPVASKLAEGVHVSRFEVIPKSHQPGKWRLIVDLSHPPGNSVNDGVDPDLCSLVYASVDQAASTILGLGHRSVLAKPMWLVRIGSYQYTQKTSPSWV